MNKDYIKNKYKFLSSIDIDTLFLISKLNINYEDVSKCPNRKNILKYLKKYASELKKINKKNEVNNIRDINNLDINTLFYMKKNKINLEELNKKYDYICNMDLNYYPDSNIIINKINRYNKISKCLYSVLMIISIITLVISSYNLYIWNSDNNKLKKISGNISKVADVKETEVESTDLNDEVEVISDDYFKYSNISQIDVNFDELLKVNSNTKGWIKVNGTDINYPFVQTNDNEYYLKHSYDNSYNKKGWVYLDYRNDINNLSKNTILYAHGLMNNQMFGSLRKVINTNWAKSKDNRIIKIRTQDSMLLFEVFSSYTIEPESYYITSEFNTDSEFNDFLSEIKSRSFYNYDVSLTTTDKILTLSSCYDNKKRMVIHAKLIAQNK